MKLIDAAAFRAGARRGSPPADGVVAVSVGRPRAYDDGSRKIGFVFSDGSVDRMGDTINPAGWAIESFMRNPVALFGHDSSAPPIGRARNVRVAGGQLLGDIEFMPPETYEFADTIYRMVAGGWLNAVSVGFLPLEYDWSDDEGREWGLDFKRQELLEISVVPVPANGNALAEARAKGIDTGPLAEWAGRALNRRAGTPAGRRDLERLRDLAREPAGRRHSSEGSVTDRAAYRDRTVLLADVRERQVRLAAPAWRGAAEREQRIAELCVTAGFASDPVDPRVTVANAAWRLRGMW